MSTLELLRAVVESKQAYWNALRDLECAISPEGDLSDRATDRLADYIDELSACAVVPESVTEIDVNFMHEKIGS